VTRYASGEHAFSVSALEGWNDERMRCDLDNLYAAAVAVRRCPRDCEDRLVFERFSVRAAILLHAEREIWEQFGSPVSEQLVRCGTGPQSKVVERLAALLILVDPEAKVFLERFYVAMARRAQWSHCLLQAEWWARAGLDRLPKGGTLLLTRAIALETLAFLTSVPAPRRTVLGQQALRQFEAQTAKVSGLWEGVRRAFEDALAVDPGRHEARLRLGRVFLRLTRIERAQACFEDVLAKGDDPDLLYLAHLFLGRIHEGNGRLTEAEKEYQAAHAIRPFSEPAAVALSHARLLIGDLEGARDILVSTLETHHRRTDIDPYKRYPMAHTSEGQAMLETLRGELIP
jgi:tetratricopeptide (TPR) repeat protein